MALGVYVGHESGSILTTAEIVDEDSIADLCEYYDAQGRNILLQCDGGGRGELFALQPPQADGETLNPWAVEFIPLAEIETGDSIKRIVYTYDRQPAVLVVQNLGSICTDQTFGRYAAHVKAPLPEDIFFSDN